jgi:hypothetical protein
MGEVCEAQKCEREHNERSQYDKPLIKEKWSVIGMR